MSFALRAFEPAIGSTQASPADPVRIQVSKTGAVFSFHRLDNLQTKLFGFLLVPVQIIHGKRAKSLVVD
jgi:hypothetical protein